MADEPLGVGSGVYVSSQGSFLPCRALCCINLMHCTSKNNPLTLQGPGLSEESSNTEKCSFEDRRYARTQSWIDRCKLSDALLESIVAKELIGGYVLLT